MAARSRSQDGFLGFVLGNPLLLLSAGLGIALLVAGATAKVYQHQRDSAREDAARANIRAVNLQVALDEVRVIGEKAEKAAKEKEAKQRRIFDEATSRYKRELAGLNAHLVELRNRPPTDSGGREIPVTPSGSKGPDGVPADLVPLASYLALQELAAQDALQLVQLQDWITAQGFPVE